MTGRAPTTLLALLVVAACAPAARPATAPEPASDSVATAAMEQLERKAPAPVAKPAPEAPRPAPAPRESRGTVAMLEAVDAPATTPPAGASWDIEVKEYLTHDRVEFYLRRFTGP